MNNYVNQEGKAQTRKTEHLSVVKVLEEYSKYL